MNPKNHLSHLYPDSLAVSPKCISENQLIEGGGGRSKPDNNNQWSVDEKCIACDACVLIAEKHFKVDEKAECAYITQQPVTSKEIALCKEAMEACPVEAIHPPKKCPQPVKSQL